MRRQLHHCEVLHGCAATLFARADEVASWAEKDGLLFSVSKTAATLFSRDTHHVRLDQGVTLSGRPALP